MANNKGLGYSPLTDKVYFGKQNIKKRIWVGEKQDVTDSFLQVLMDGFLPEGSFRDIDGENGSENIVINIKNNKNDISNMIKVLEKRFNEL